MNSDPDSGGRTVPGDGDPVGDRLATARPKDDRTLELSPERLERLLDAAIEHLREFVRTLPEQPASDVEGSEELARSLIEPLPREGSDPEELLDTIFDRVVPKAFNTTHPGYLAYIPGGGLLQSAVADLVATATNRYTSIWMPAPGFAQIEAQAVRWLCEIVGYPGDALGLLTTGGSMANFSALVTIRRTRLPEDFLKGTIYTSNQVHHSLQKAAVLAGFPPDNVREVGVDGEFRVRLDEMEERIAADRAAGFTPCAVVGSAGTTNTGAVDDLEGLADLAHREGLWFHVDAAYGGFFALTDEGREVLRGMERSDSLILDPHKGMFLPYGTGSLLVRDREALREAHTVGAGYLPTMQDDPDFVDFSELSPELSREHRGLRVWLPLKMHGIEPFRRNLEEKLALARHAAGALRAIEGLEIVAEPQLSTVAFRLERPDWDAGERNARNRRFIEAVNARKRVYLSGTTLDDHFVLRLCVLSYRTHRQHIEAGLDDIREAAAQVRGAQADSQVR